MISPGGTDEKVTIYRDADHLDIERGRERVGRERSVPEAWHQFCDLLQMAIQVWRPGCVGAAAHQGVGSRECQAQTVVRRHGTGKYGAQGSDRKKALGPPEKREAIRRLVEAHGLSIQRACRSVGLSRSAWYKPLVDWLERDRALVDALLKLAHSKPGLGFWKLYRRLRRQGHRWNHKRVWRVYCLLKLNRRRRTKKRVPTRDPMPLMTPARPNQVWSADFMSDALYHGVRFQTFNVLDDFNREALAIEIDTSLPSSRLVRVFEQLKRERGLPGVLRTDNDPEFLGECFTTWCKNNGIFIDHIEPGKPNQNAYIERFNRTYRTEVLDTWLFKDLDEVREMTWAWMLEYNEERDHDSLGGMTPAEVLQKARSSTFELST